VAKKKPEPPAQSPEPPRPDTITSKSIREDNKDLIERKLADIVKRLNGLNSLVASEIIAMLPEYYDEHGESHATRLRKRRKKPPKKSGGMSGLSGSFSE
jgi:hypothetical protein